MMSASSAANYGRERMTREEILAGADPEVAAMLSGMYRAYCEVHRERDAEATTLLHCEETFTSRIFRLPDMVEYENARLGGKIDKVVARNGRTILVDHKTTSMSIDSDSVYWRQLQIDSQHQHYEILLLSNGILVDDIMWDVVRKPAIKRRAKRQPETLAEYSQRVYETMVGDIGRYFSRYYVERFSVELLEYGREVLSIVEDIDRCREEDSHYRNPGSCFSFGTPCVYLGICSGFDTPGSDRWVAREYVHPELDLETEEQVYTNSRIRCWQSCRKKHYFRYELGIERRDAEEKKALAIGSLWHNLMDLYWGERCETT